MDNKKKVRNLLLYLGIPILIIIITAAVLSTNKSTSPKTSELEQYFVQDMVDSFNIDYGSGQIEITLKEGMSPIKSTDPDSQSATTATQPATEQQKTQSNSKKSKIVVKGQLADIQRFLDDIKPYYNPASTDEIPHNLTRATDNSILMEMIPTLIIMIILIVAWVLIMKKMGGGGLGGKEMSFGKAKIKNTNDEKRKTTFDDVAGEAGVPFFSISGSDFVEMFVGVGASRVRDLFDQAKKNSPCIIFIDEIDAVGRQRGAGLGGGNDEREQTLNQLLVEMDGFGANEGVILIAATNRPDVLDPALMRPGRFDRQVVVSYPDVNGREAILRVHARKKPLAPDVNLKTIAKTTAGFTGADLENLLNEAALLAARKDKKAITMDEIKEATVKVVVGAEKKSKVMSEKEKKLTAYHEAGHAILFDKLETQDPVHEISIIPTGMAGGYTMPLPSEDKSYNSRRGMYEDIVVSLGGRVAEELIMDDISTGASNDIEKATKTARAMVTKYGMTKELGCVCYGTDNNSVFLGRDMGSRTQDYSEATAAKIDQLVLDMVNKAYGDATKILSDNMDKLHDIAKYLIKHEKMGSEDFTAVMNGTYKEPEEVEQETADKEPSAETKVDESTEG